jgi:hypothetical protein
MQFGESLKDIPPSQFLVIGQLLYSTKLRDSVRCILIIFTYTTNSDFGAFVSENAKFIFL